jgi:hypothetical protein
MMILRRSAECGGWVRRIAALLVLGAGAASIAAQTNTAPTNIAIESKVIRSGVKRFGINLSGNSFYDSGIMMRNLFFRNPGFEGYTWQTVLQCKYVKGDACADNDEWSQWPVDFMRGASYEFLYGAAKGQKGTVAASSKAAQGPHEGVWVSFGRMGVHPQAGDFYVLRRGLTEDALGGWWHEAQGGATLTTEVHDIDPKSAGKEALRIEALTPGQDATVYSALDTFDNRSFVQMNGTYTLSFRAKGVGGTKMLYVSLARLTGKFGNLTYLVKPIQLTGQWQEYKFTVTLHESGHSIGPVHLRFNVHDSAVLLDDVAFMEPAAANNPTAFRNVVVDRLRELHPGVLRYMDSGGNFGSKLDQLLAPEFARQRSGFSETSVEPHDVPIGLHEFLVLCEAVHTEPWFVIPVGFTQQEMRELIEYLSAGKEKPYGAKRIALGQTEPWTKVFPVIHLELGNETWNWGSFAGAGWQDAKAYGSHTGDIFAAARATPGYDASKFDLVMDGWMGVPWWNDQELLAGSHADTIDVAPYTFNPFNNASSIETIFGPMFAEPEAIDSRPTGLIPQQAKVAAQHGVKLAVYEVNLGVYEGKVNQIALDATIPSLGAGLSTADHMLLMLRDAGINLQAVFALPEYENGFHNTADPHANENVKLWGTVVDMGGQTNRVRPSFLAEELANEAVAERMLLTVPTGANPTWDQAENGNAQVKLAAAHYIQSFAFTDGKRTSVVLFNLSRSTALPVTLSGAMAPRGAKVEVGRLTSGHINDTNEDAQKVAITHSTLEHFDPAQPYSLPPFSMTVLSWAAQK